MTIELPPDVEASLIAEATEQGVSVQEYVARFLREKVVSGSTLGAPRRADAWRKFASEFPTTPPLSDEAVSREKMYGESD